MKLSTYKIFKFLFIISGTKFYFDYILPTNFTSKNPIYKLIYRNYHPYTWRYKDRIIDGYILITTHLILFYIYKDSPIFVNLLVNIYPIIVNLYIIYRCYRMKK